MQGRHVRRVGLGTCSVKNPHHHLKTIELTMSNQQTFAHRLRCSTPYDQLYRLVQNCAIPLLLNPSSSSTTADDIASTEPKMCCRHFYFWRRQMTARTPDSAPKSPNEEIPRKASGDKTPARGRTPSSAIVTQKASSSVVGQAGVSTSAAVAAPVGSLSKRKVAKKDAKKSSTKRSQSVRKTPKATPNKTNKKSSQRKPHPAPLVETAVIDYPMCDDEPEIFENVAAPQSRRERMRSTHRPPSVAHRQFINWMMEDSEKAAANPPSNNVDDAAGVTTDAGAIAAPVGMASLRHYLEAARRFIRRRPYDDEATLHGVDLCLPEANYDSAHSLQAAKSAPKAISRTPPPPTPASVTNFTDAEVERTSHSKAQQQQQSMTERRAPADSTTMSMAQRRAEGG